MPELTDTQALPVLPLATGVVLPNTVATLTLETDEARAAVAAANDGDGRLLLVPRIDGRYARVGTVAVVEESGELPNGLAAAIIRGLHRATPRRRRGRHRRPRCGSRPTRWPTTRRSARAEELGRELRAVLSVLGERRRSRRLPELLRSTTGPGRAGRRLRRVVRHADRAQGRAARGGRRSRTASSARSSGHATRSPSTRSPRRSARRSARAWRSSSASSCCASSSRPSARSSARAPTTATPSRSTARRLAERRPARRRRASRSTQEIDRLERTSEQSPEHGWIRTWLDTILELPWGVRSEERPRRRRGAARSSTPTTPVSTT